MEGSLVHVSCGRQTALGEEEESIYFLTNSNIVLIMRCHRNAATDPINFCVLFKGFAVYFYFLEFFLQIQVFFQAAYDGASTNRNPATFRSIVMPPLLCDVETSPIRELTSIYASPASPQAPSTSESGSSQQGSSQPTWRRAFGCSVDSAHVLTALGRIERGCRDVGVPIIASTVWESRIRDAGGGKLTLERLWGLIANEAFKKIVLQDLRQE